MYFFLVFPENRAQHFMQIVSQGDNLHEMCGHILGGNKKKDYQMFTNI